MERFHCCTLTRVFIMQPQVLALIATVYVMGSGWEPLGPFGGSAAIIQVEQPSGALLAATSNAQIYRSENDGELWKPLPFPAQLRANLHALVIDRQNAGVYFAGLSSDVPQYSGIMRTSDRGITWERIREPGLTDVWSIAIWQRDSSIIAAGAENGLWLTQDSGATWKHIVSGDSFDLKPVVSLAFDPWDSKILYAGTPRLAWKTADGGATWQLIHKGMRDDSDIFSILIESQRQRKIFAATCGGIYRSPDGGASWTKLSEAKGAASRTYHIAQDPFRANVLLAGTSLGLIKSVDSGHTWRRLSSLSTRWIEFDSGRTNRVFIATDEAGLFRSDDAGETRQPINQGFSNRLFSAFSVADDALWVMALTAGGSSVLRLAEPEGWQEFPLSGITGPVNGISGTSPDDLWIHDTLSMDEGSVLAATSRGLARSRDSGVTWQLEPGALAGSTVTALCKHPTRRGVFFAARFGEIFVTRDHARTWTPLMAGDEGPDDLIALLVLPAKVSPEEVSPGNRDRLLALSRSRGVYTIALPTRLEELRARVAP